MLKARSSAGGAAAIATVETELAGGVATLARQVGIGEDFADGVPRPDITHRIGTRRLANGRLVDKHNLTQLFSTQQAGMRAGRLGGLAKVAQQGRGEHILHQRGLARAADTGNTYQALQRNLDVDIFEVVLGGTFQNQARRVGSDHALETHAHLLAPTQVGTGQRVGTTQCLRAAVKNNLPAFFTGAGTHVDHAVGGQHHRRVVLHHHQRVARITQTLHGHDDAVHVARVQADAGFIQHKQGVDQGSTERGGQVDTLHFAPTEGAALAVQREVANADVTQVFEPGADFFQQQFERLGFGL